MTIQIKSKFIRIDSRNRSKKVSYNVIKTQYFSVTEGLDYVDHIIFRNNSNKIVFFMLLMVYKIMIKLLFQILLLIKMD